MEHKGLSLSSSNSVIHSKLKAECLIARNTKIHKHTSTSQKEKRKQAVNAQAINAQIQVFMREFLNGTSGRQKSATN